MAVPCLEAVLGEESACCEFTGGHVLGEESACACDVLAAVLCPKAVATAVNSQVATAVNSQVATSARAAGECVRPRAAQSFLIWPNDATRWPHGAPAHAHVAYVYM